MTRYLLGTNIISNALKPQPSASLIDWLARQRDEDLFIASLTIAEIRRGILELPSGRRRDTLEAWFAGNDGPQSLFAGRVLSFDERAGLIWARLMAVGKTTGRTRSTLDMILARGGGGERLHDGDGQRNGFQGASDLQPHASRSRGGKAVTEKCRRRQPDNALS